MFSPLKSKLLLRSALYENRSYYDRSVHSEIRKNLIRTNDINIIQKEDYMKVEYFIEFCVRVHPLN
jgi:hypothetical protein